MAATISPFQRQADASVERLLLRHILRRVSRSFYLSLVILPRSVRSQVSLAYLFCRTADTIADTRILPQPERMRALETFRSQFRQEVTDFEALAHIQAVLQPHLAQEGEGYLLQHLDDCFRLLMKLEATDRHLIRQLVLALTRGMEMDLTHFPGETAATACALPDMVSLDHYTYYVAGVVGQFWTDVHVRHVAAFRPTDHTALCDMAIRFGKGLQMTNILKDIGKDLHNGRCYLPATELAALGVRVGELTEGRALRRIRPLLRTLMWQTLAHLDRARDYVLRLPWRAFRLRVSCMWPLLFAVQTLEVVQQADRLLDPRAPIKISRGTVYRSMFVSLWCLVVPRLFVAYYHRLRHRLVSLLEREC
jgi:farnesyl-diphosphate farnesyltransferase